MAGSRCLDFGFQVSKVQVEQYWLVDLHLLLVSLGSLRGLTGSDCSSARHDT